MILIDFDGTLIDDFEMVFRLWKSLADRFGIKLSRQGFRQKMNPEWQKFVKDVYGINMNDKKQLIKKLYLKRKLKDEYSKNIINENIIPKLAGYLKNKDFGIVTSGFSQVVKQVTGKAGLKPSLILSSTELGISDKTKLLQTALEKVKAEYYIGDTEQDVRAGRNNGLKTISVTWGFHTRKRLEKANPDYLVETPEQLIELLDKLQPI